MRLSIYLSYSVKDEKTNIFRAMNIKLVPKEQTYTPVISDICQKFLIPEKTILDLKKSLNEELKKTYKGKYLFDFCLDDGISLEKIKANKKRRDRLMIKMFEANDVLEHIKKQVEKKISKETP